MDINEIRALSDADLEGALVDAKQELWKIRFDLATRHREHCGTIRGICEACVRMPGRMRAHAGDSRVDVHHQPGAEREIVLARREDRQLAGSG